MDSSDWLPSQDSIAVVASAARAQVVSPAR